MWWKMEHTVPELLKLAKRSEEYRDRYFRQRALRNINWYNGNYSVFNGLNLNNLDVTDFIYYVNLVYSTSRTIVSSIYSRFPEFSFFLQGDLTKSIYDNYGVDIKFQVEKLERVLEAITKIYFREMKVGRTNRKAILDAVLTGYGVTKIGYNVDFDKEKKDLLEQNLGIPEDKWVELASNIEVSELVKRSEPYVLRVHPMNMLFPVDAEDFNRISWQMEVIYKDKDEVEKMYGLKGKLPASYMPDYLNDANKSAKDQQNIVKLYEFHSLDPAYPRIKVFCEGYDKFLEDKEHPLFDKATSKVKNMYQYVWFNESYFSIYPQSDIDLIEAQIRESTFQVQKRVEHVRKWVSQLIVQGIIDEDEKLKLIQGEDGAYIHLMNTDARISVVERANLSADFYNNIISIRNEIYETLGLTDYAAGGSTEKRKATEAQLMERSRIDRVQERVDIIEDFSYAQVDTFVEIMKEYEQVGRAFKTQLGDDRVSMYFAGELLKMGDIAIQVVPGSTVSLDREAEIRRFERLSQFLVNANMAQPGLVNTSKWFSDGLNKLGYAGSEYINDVQSNQVAPPGIANNIPNVQGTPNLPNVPTPTPQDLGNLPATFPGGI